MRGIGIGLVLFFALIFFSSCDRTQSRIRELKSLSEEVLEESSTYTKNDWNRIDKKIARLTKELDEADLNEQQIREVGHAKGLIYGEYTKWKINNFGNTLQKWANEFEGIVTGVSESFSYKEETPHKERNHSRRRNRRRR